MAISAPFRIAILDDYQRVACEFERWSELGSDAEVVFFHDHVDDPKQLAARLRDFQVVVAMRERTPLPSEVFDRLDDLRLIVTAGTTNAVIDVPAARRRGIVVSGTTGSAGASATIELAWALILASIRHTARHDAAVRNGAWQISVGQTLRGRTLGIVGLGKLGPLMVPVGKAFGMRVVAWSTRLTDGRAAEIGIERLDREEFFRSADVITVHLKLSSRSIGYVSRADLRQMKPTSYLVNTSRGAVVDEGALLDALREGWIAGAALDVFSTEPLPLDHPFRTLPNLVLSPHVGYVSEDSYREFFTQFVEDILAFRAGHPIRVVDPTLW